MVILIPYLDVYNTHSYHGPFKTGGRHGEVYSIQHYVMKFVSDLRQVGSFLWILPFPLPIKPTAQYN